MRGGNAGEHCSAFLTGFSSATVYAHALELQQLLPCWQDATPQVCWCFESGVRGSLHGDVNVVGSGVTSWQ